MTIIEQMIAAGIPVIPEQSNELTGVYSYVGIMPEQLAAARDIITPPDYAELRWCKYPAQWQIQHHGGAGGMRLNLEINQEN